MDSIIIRFYRKAGNGQGRIEKQEKSVQNIDTPGAVHIRLLLTRVRDRAVFMEHYGDGSDSKTNDPVVYILVCSAAVCIAPGEINFIIAWVKRCSRRTALGIQREDVIDPPLVGNIIVHKAEKPEDKNTDSRNFFHNLLSRISSINWHCNIKFTRCMPAPENGVTLADPRKKLINMLKTYIIDYKNEKIVVKG